jgi:superfamily II DNA or RNA helicase
MARYSVTDPRVEALVLDLVLPVVIRLGSVNAACDWFNKRLGSTGQLYPNRLHTLLSEDPTKSVNEGTVSLVEAVAAGSPALPPQDEAAVAKLEARVREAWMQARAAGNPVAELAANTSLPRAVARALLKRLDLYGGGEDSPTAPPASPSVSTAPDWSYQDTAVQRCLAALAERVGAKIGLVLPTGAGKTRVALRIALEWLARRDGNVVWVTHRMNLRDQAHEELQKLLAEGVPNIPVDASKLLAQRIEILMLGQLQARLALPAESAPTLAIIDEGHHAAAASYAPVFSTPYSLPALILTATPNRTDGLPIGIDRIAFSITYRELAQRRAILIPTFEDSQVDDFDWSPAAVKNLADEVVARAADDCHKVLVLAPRVERVKEFYAALLDRLAEEDSHPLSADDIGFAHGSGNSMNVSNAEFLARFKAKPCAIYVSAELLLEGFDDPAINAVFITYATSSVVKLMQAAGRCVRYSPGKRRAFVIRARNDSLAYHFEQRWMYQELSDLLRPRLEDVGYRDRDDLIAKARALLAEHRVPPEQAERALAEVEQVAPGRTCRVMLHGLPFFGEPGRFYEEAEWGAIVEHEGASEVFRWVFNDFCARGANIADPTDVLAKYSARYGFPRAFQPASDWRLYADLLTAMYRAYQEVYSNGSTSADGVHRPFATHGATTWLKYVAFSYEPKVDAALQRFLEDCHNRDQVAADYLAASGKYPLIVKLPVPMGPNEAHLLDAQAASAFGAAIGQLRDRLRDTAPAERWAAYAATLARMACLPLPLRVQERLDDFLTDADASLRIYAPAEQNPN